MAVFVTDFDGTLVATNPNAGDPEPGPWLPGAREMLRSVMDAGHTWVVYSVRNNPKPFPDTEPGAWRRWFDAMVERIRGEFAADVDAGRLLIDDGTHGKPFGIHYLDDRAIAIGEGPGKRSLDWVRGAYGAW